MAVTGQPLSRVTAEHPAAPSGCGALTQAQRAALRRVHDVGGLKSSVNVYAKANTTLCLVGEFHGHTAREAAAIQTAARVFPLRGIELYGADDMLLERYPHAFADRFGVGMLLGRSYSSGIDAARLEHLGYSQLCLVKDCVQAELVRQMRRRCSVQDVDYAVTLQAGGYERVLAWDAATAHTVADTPLDHWSAVQTLSGLVNTGFPAVLLEADYRLAPFDYLFDALLSAELFTVAFGAGAALKSYEAHTAAATIGDSALFHYAERMDTVTDWCMAASVAILGLFLCAAFGRKSMPRDVYMARSADHFMMQQPPAPTMLAQVGAAHVRGIHATLTSELEWQHLGTGEIL